MSHAAGGLMLRDAPELGGTLLSRRAAADWLAARGTRDSDAAPAIASWAASMMRALGPASGQRGLHEALTTLFAHDLGYTVRASAPCAIASTASGDAIVLHGTDWGRRLVPPSRALLRACVECGTAWGIVFNGIALAIADARAGASRRVAVFTLDDLAARAPTAALAGALIAPSGVEREIAEAVALSDRAGLDVRRGLREGVERALSSLGRQLPFDESIATLFRLLFVLFAEARTLVPMWHAVYREHYSLQALASPTREPRGVWAALEGARRLLGEGCSAGTLEVPAFNGRLFSSTGVRRWARTASLDSALDEPASEALASLVRYRPGRGGARRVDYAELDVEELGSIYERVLDLEPASEGRARKESGSFYTPRALTTFVVRRTLAPLVKTASSEQILSLRVVDPAMGSGAFLVAALRYLAAALERALVREGALPERDVEERDRHELRRLVAQRCLYGVDANPTAVMLAKLSIWLATLSSGKPLTFLDHRLRCGDSLIGIDPDVARRAPGTAAAARALPLFDAAGYQAAIEGGALRAIGLARMNEDTLTDVRAKERRFAAEASDASALAPWRALCDSWCAWWFMSPDARPDDREYGAIADAVLRRSRVLSPRALGGRLREAADLKARHHFFHWPLEFPDAFPHGFDAVIGNPPWEMLRAEGGSAGRAGTKAFARGAGVYRFAGDGHVNLYQLFVERALQLVGSGGRIGLVVPWGLMADEGSGRLRARVLDGTSIDTLLRFDNRNAIFQAHRSLRFAAISMTMGAAAATLPLNRESEAARLDDLPDEGPLPGSMSLGPAALGVLGGRARRIPDAANAAALAIALKIASSNSALGDPAGWAATFGRELNLTDDRAHFVARNRGTLPVLEGKHLHPHQVDSASARHHITRASAARLLSARPFDRPRLAYRDVTAQTNAQTLIAAIVPAGCVTGHSLFCLKGDGWSLEAQRALCAVLNSAVANFLMRLFVSAHVTTGLMAWLPVPDKSHATAALGTVRSHGPAIDRLVARLYGLADEEFRLIAA